MRYGTSFATSSNKPLPLAFHSFYGKFNYVLNTLDFVVQNSDPLFHKKLDFMKDEINRKIIQFIGADKKEYDRYTTFLEKISKKNKSKKNTKRTQFKFKQTKVLNVLGELRTLNRIHGYLFKMINEMALIYLISQYEEFVKNCLELIFTKQPKALTSAKKIEISQILNAKSQSEISKTIVKNEIDEIINGGIDSIFEYFKKMNIDMAKIPSENKFREIFYRRNVIVHNAGIADTAYVLKTKKPRSLNKPLIISKNYFSNSKKLFHEFSHTLAHNLDQKFNPEKNFAHSAKKDVFHIPK